MFFGVVVGVVFFGLCSLLMNFIIRKMMNVRIMKLIVMVMNEL